jgi:uncharacterized membrane protein
MKKVERQSKKDEEERRLQDESRAREKELARQNKRDGLISFFLSLVLISSAFYIATESFNALAIIFILIFVIAGVFLFFFSLFSLGIMTSESLADLKIASEKESGIECPFCHNKVRAELKKQGGLIMSTMKGAIFLPWGVKEILKKDAYYCPNCKMKISEA